VEFALVVGLFAFILYGLVAFGSALATKQRVTSAVADGARATVGAADLATAQSQAQARVQAKLGLTGYTATYLADTTNCAAPASCIRVTVVYPLPPSPGLGLVTPPNVTSNAVVQYK
jgi:Flp pilus assembly protein TadG